MELSAQASRFHASEPRNGCGHSPLELFDRVEAALMRTNVKGHGRWVRQPSRELGIDGFDDLWLDPDEVPIAEYVPPERVRALRAALIERAWGQGRQAAERHVVPDPAVVVEEVGVDPMDMPSPVANARREPGLM